MNFFKKLINFFSIKLIILLILIGIIAVFQIEQNINTERKIRSYSTDISKINIELDKVQQDIIKLKTDNIIEKLDEIEEGIIDPYENTFQEIDSRYDIQIIKFEEYGTGVKIGFKILNKTSVDVSNQKLTFILLESKYSDNELGKKDYTIINKIPSSTSKEGEVQIPSIDYKSIKFIKVVSGEATLHYYDN